MIKRNIKVIAALAIVASIGVGAATTHAAALSKGTAKAVNHANKNFKKGNGDNFLKTKLDALVKAGTITQDQETAALNLLKPSSTDKKTNAQNVLKTKLDTLVTAGTITQDEETAVLNLLTSSTSTESKGVKNALKAKLDTLVTKGTITQGQETAIQNLFVHKIEGTQTVKEKSTDGLKTKLDTLVTAKTITQDQETAVLDKIKQQEADRKAEMDKVKNMTEAERKAYFESKKTTEKTDVLSSLVTAGTITQDQKTAIQNIFKGNRDKDAQVGKEKFAKLIKTKLDTLVTAGTITQAQETAMINDLTSETSQN